ncbi:MAG: FAD-binding oxidoreductase [Patescibacteria group bacterium]|nr:FAD-binding oxidoreductase [Patescibacteria group bacterium]MDE1965808.1 FAD-binding oxidoreductase [Patescibacteria group bacterium]
MDVQELKSRLTDVVKGDVSDAPEDLAKASRDTSLFMRMPKLVVFPKDADDVAAAVRVVRAAREGGAQVALAARSAGTDMSGGPLTDGVVISFTRYMNHMGEVGAADGTHFKTSGEGVHGSEDLNGLLPNHAPRAGIETSSALNANGLQSAHVAGYAITEPGVFYRDFEKETLKQDLILPSYPASRELCAMGGIVANNSGGERTLEYGKTEDYIEEMEVVLSDGSKATFKALTSAELDEKKKLETLEGSIYRTVDEVITKNADLIAEKKPEVSKNSAGYALWNVRTPDGGVNLAKLICGSQGTLALWTRARLGLVKDKPHRAMLVIFLHDLAPLPDIVAKVLPLNPESFESYDDKTFTFATRFLFDLLKQMGLAKAVHLGIEFLPEVETVLVGGVPKLILMAEFAENTIEEADAKAKAAQDALAEFHLETKIEKNEAESEKYWIVRRESFALLRKSLHGYYASPFIDDFVVPPASYPKFLPELSALLAQYQDRFIYTIAGHIGNGNFHIIPLMDLSKPISRETILELAPKVYELVIKYGGTTTGEHNDGIIRTPYLPMLFGAEMVALFEEVKKAFDPENILNPGKKVGGTFEDIKRYMLTASE